MFLKIVRDAWDSFHAASSAFAALALCVLLIAMLRETQTPSLARADQPASRGA